ncbi:MAG: hypothetical protein PHD83_03655 [Caldisericia bacterium]|nr:hypothetical protein [Caldisericia bacterium]
MVQQQYLFNFKDGKIYPILINNTEKFYPEGATNDGKYVVVSTDGKKPKTIVIEMPECKEVPLPNAGNFEFITWLE